MGEMPDFRAAGDFAPRIDDCRRVGGKRQGIGYGRITIGGPSGFRTGGGKSDIRHGPWLCEKNLGAMLVKRTLTGLQDPEHPQAFVAVGGWLATVSDTLQEMLTFKAQGLHFRNFNPFRVRFCRNWNVISPPDFMRVS